MTSPFDDMARRSAIHFAVDQEVELADRLVHQAASPTLADSRWRVTFGEAVGDLDAAFAHGQHVDEELRLLAALCQWKLERIAERDAGRPVGEMG